ncbi:copper resistance protein CopZ [Pseudoflavonifractor sp. MSJ-30]|uniref:heavy-metal-associated domain-containing protein n=1 Tax=Pseudoflavonifractor sp. MSJ-30 TaxID=2841525 RepID=UPI001C11A911|nr:heavy-metal-associated domain-containing protein [Pseudoflavonifractor sp. MSJ-30]MBU5451604.1 copper resistance protein CopZ [Pseudoflavonifractor sp. MSJ-30]
MIKTVVKVEGMACSMCEAHVNDAVRGAFPVDKVTSSHSKGETVILSKEPLDETALRAVIDGSGYGAGSVTVAPYEKKGFFHFGK